MDIELKNYRLIEQEVRWGQDLMSIPNDEPLPKAVQAEIENILEAAPGKKSKRDSFFVFIPFLG